MSENSNGRNWWHTVPGVITAVTGLLTALSGLVLALHQAGIFAGGNRSVQQEQVMPRSPRDKPGESEIYEPDEPSGSAAAHRDLETFLQTYFETLNRCKPVEILGLYADKVDYYGAGNISKDFILQDKDHYCQRWAEVRYERIGALSVAETGMNNEQQLKFNIRFFGRSPERGATISGDATNTLVVRAIDGEFKIVSEKQKVIQRKQRP